ncbi:hypothetical protein Tco_1419722 [Tanacetum coccineum]
MMDDPNITMEEYIKLQAEKAQRHGRTFNWQTSTYGKIYYDDLNFFIDFEADFPAIVYNDALTSNENVSSEPTVSIYYVIKANIDFSVSFSDFEDEDYTVIYNKGNCGGQDLNHDMDLPPRDQRHPFLRFVGLEYSDEDILGFELRLERIFHRQIHRVQVLDFAGLTEGMIEDIDTRLRMVHSDELGQDIFVSNAWRRLFDIR